MSKRKLLLVAVLLLVAAAAGYLLFRKNSRGVDGTLRVSGNIEVVDVELSFRIPGWLRERPADEGQVVRAGDVLARLDDEELSLEVAAREADVRAAQAALAELKAGSRPEEIAAAEATTQKAQGALDELVHGSRPEEIAAAEAAVMGATAEVERTKLDYERLDALRAKGVAGAREFDTARLAYESAKARLAEAKEQHKLVQEGPRKERIDQVRSALVEATERLALVRKGPRQETIDQAAARLEQVQQALAMARTRLRYCTLKSPLAALVLSKNVEPGEYVSAGTPIVTVGDIRHVYLRAYVEEPDQGKVKVGQHVRVYTDTFPGKPYPGTVSFIAQEAEFTPKNVQTRKERVKLVYRIKVDIDNPDMDLKPGMPADAEVEAGG